MRKYRFLVLILLFVLLTGMVSAAGKTQPPYAIKVNRAMNTVTIYGLDENGQHTVPVRAMICSTARRGYVTPLGSYELAGYRSEWRLMVDGTYGQYATCFKGNYLFHSICYADDSHDAMIREAYNNLGSAASMGCVRLETADAKWIYDNCPAGTPVTIYDDPNDPGPLGKPARTVDHIAEEAHTGWDPTDPAAGNPWRQKSVTALELDRSKLTVTAGETASLQAMVEPADALVYWTSSADTVAKVDASGKVTALSAGTAEITVQGLNGRKAVCTVTVEGELLPFDDLLPGAWYYPELRQALESELFQGMSQRQFAPHDAMSRAMVVQVLYNLENKPEAPEALPFADVAEEVWYRDAVAWAVSEELVRGVSETAFAPDRTMTRQELAAVLWRYAGEPKAKTDLSAFSDGRQAPAFARDALCWVVEAGLLQGSGGKLLPGNTVSRVETAVILQRYTEEY